VIKILQLAKLVQQHGVAQMQVGRGRIEPGFDSQAVPFTQAVLELGLDEKLVGAPFEDGERVVYRAHIEQAIFTI
jgi:hypothetical protein